MEMPINTVAVLVILLVLAAVLLVLFSRGGNQFSEPGGDKIDTAGDVSECERLCWECCRAPPKDICDIDVIQDECGCSC